MIWDSNDIQWTKMLHWPIHATLFLNPACAYSCNLGFDGEVMKGLLTCLVRMVTKINLLKTINCEINIYPEASGLFGFVDVANKRSILYAM